MLYVYYKTVTVLIAMLRMSAIEFCCITSASGPPQQNKNIHQTNANLLIRTWSFMICRILRIDSDINSQLGDAARE